LEEAKIILKSLGGDIPYYNWSTSSPSCHFFSPRGC